jgi:hypothetical protein
MAASLRAYQQNLLTSLSGRSLVITMNFEPRSLDDHLSILFTGPQAFLQFSAAPLELYKPTAEEIQRISAKLTELDNVFNHPVLGLPKSAIPAVATTTPTTNITSLAFGAVPQVIQFAIKMRF